MTSGEDAGLDVVPPWFLQHLGSRFLHWKQTKVTTMTRATRAPSRPSRTPAKLDPDMSVPESALLLGAVLDVVGTGSENQVGLLLLSATKSVTAELDHMASQHKTSFRPDYLVTS